MTTWRAGGFPSGLPGHVLMTTDAVGGVWRYSVDLARALNENGARVSLVCVGPAPSQARRAETADLPLTDLVELDAPLDWLAARPAEIAAVPGRLAQLAEERGVDLLHLNLPSQAAGMRTDLPVVVTSHSCLVTWWKAMREEPLPGDWRWQFDINRAGLSRAEAVIAPTSSHGEALRRAYRGVAEVCIVPNAARMPAPAGDAFPPRQPFVLAAARWWDEAKNGALLDRVSELVDWPVRAAGACRGPNGQEFVFLRARAEGELSSGATRELMRKAAIFVSPSLYEPFGLAALEAARSGAALVMADIPTYRELWDGVARFADPRDPAAFATQIQDLIADDAAREQMARLGREKAATFTARNQLEALLPVYALAAARALRPLAAE